MSAQLMILPTGEALRSNKEVFSQLPTEGLPLMVITHYLLDLLSSGEPEQLSSEQLVQGWMCYLEDSRLLTERLARFLSTPAFATAFYALYVSMHQLQELMLTAPAEQGGFLSALSHHGWVGQDMVVAREITTLHRGH